VETFWVRKIPSSLPYLFVVPFLNTLLVAHFCPIFKMRLTLLPILALLPTALLADDQIPLIERVAGWFDKAKAYIPSAIPNPIDAGASAVAAKKVERINIRNYQRMLAAKPEGEEEWMVYVTGGNKTCSGRCGRIDLLWNVCFPATTGTG
jgi:hypothetical protein